jgi:hypothetical protein
VYNCPWFQIRDGVIIFWWVCSFCGAALLAADAVDHFRLRFYPGSWFFIFLVVVVFFAGLSSIWEVALICFGFACCFYHLGCFGRLSDDTSSSVSVVVSGAGNSVAVHPDVASFAMSSDDINPSNSSGQTAGLSTSLFRGKLGITT